ncbi:MAG: class I SAM-dependent methyltransferase [Myxococcota bacterium]|nr:class I SAM-dependent methyltransferase [Myxococcota bacterium]
MALVYDTIVSAGLADLYERIADAVASRLSPRGAVLDVGCGSGRTVAALARRLPAARFEGVDLSETMLALARRNAAGLPNVRFRRADAMRLPHADASFDAAISVASIKHWPDQDRGIAEMARVVRSGGRVLVIEADRECTARAARRFVGLWRFAPGPLRPLAVAYFRRFVAAQGLDADTLRRRLESAGLRDIEVDRDGYQPAVYGIATHP